MNSRLMGYIVFVVLFVGAGLSLALGASSGNTAKAATPAIPNMLLQTIGEAENQCRIAQESCMTNSRRCKTNDDYEARRTKQCRNRIEQRYEQCKDRRLSTLAPLRSNRNALATQTYRRKAVTKACGRQPDRNDLQKSCPARSGGCYSAGYCTQQYQRCSSNAFLEEQSYNQRGTSQPPQPPQQTEQTEQYTPPPAPRTTPRKPSRPVSGLPWNDKRPTVYRVEIENTCKHPVKAAYGVRHRDGDRSYGWQALKRGRNTITFPEVKAVTVQIYLKQGELASVRARGKLVVYEHDSFGPFFLKDDGDFDLRYDLIHTRTPPRPGYRKTPFAMLAQGFGKNVKRFKIIKCKRKR